MAGISGDSRARQDSTATQPRQRLLSSEQLRLDLPVAGPTSRMAAYVIDLVAVFTIGVAVALVLAGSSSLVADWIQDLIAKLPELVGQEDTPVERSDVQFFFLFLMMVMMALQLSVECLYFTCFESLWQGQSPGKRLMRLRVVSDDGSAVRPMQALTRNLLRIVDILPADYIVGLLSMLTNESGKRLGDWAASTVVIRLDRPEAVRPLDDAEREGDDAFVFSPAQLAKIGANELKLLRQTLRRSAELDEERRTELLANAARVLAAKIGTSVADGQREAFLRALHRAATRHR